MGDALARVLDRRENFATLRPFFLFMDSTQSLRRRPRLGVPLALLFLALLGAGGFYAYKHWQEKRRIYRYGAIVMPERIARVPSHWSVDTLASRLKKSGKIHDVGAFSEAAAKVGLHDVPSGAYYLPAIASPEQLARVFKAGPSHVRVTFPEGFTGWQIAARLKKEGFPGANGLEALMYPPGKIPPYEGTLGADTYFLPIGANSKTLIAQLQHNFKGTLQALPRPFPKVNGTPLSTSEVVILASLVEREAASAEEMPQIAGVIVNRLNRPMRLQVDATIQYARLLRDGGQGHKARLLYEDLKIRSPYNTYRNDGLPPGPICNPGRAALKAAAQPAQTDALYYVYSPRLKKHLFSRSYSEFLKNKRICAQETAERDKDKRHQNQTT